MNAVLEDNQVSLDEFTLHPLQHTLLLKQNGRPKALMLDGKVEAVVLSSEVFEKMAQDAEEYRLDQGLRDEVESFARGERGTSAREFFDSIHADTERRRAELA